MSSNNKTILGSVLIDRSGSMEFILPTLINALKSFIDEITLRASVAKECQFRLTTFSNTKEVYFPSNKLMFDNIATFGEDLEFEANGCTRLVDSAIEEANILSKRLDELKEAGAEVNSWFIVLTDGEDNDSKARSSDLKRKILSLKENGVSCVLIAANINADHYGKFFGFDSTKSVQVDMDVRENDDINLPPPLFQCFRALSQNIADNMEDDRRDIGFSHLQRAASAPSRFTIDPQTQTVVAKSNDDELDDDLWNMPPPMLRRL